MAFRFKLEHEDGTPPDPPTLHTAVPKLAGRGHDSARRRIGRCASSKFSSDDVPTRKRCLSSALPRAGKRRGAFA